MNKQVSPFFAVIVIVVVVALGALYFMVRYRAHEAAWQAEARALQQQAESARRAGRGLVGGRRPGMGTRRGMRAGSAVGSPTQEGRRPSRPGADSSPNLGRAGR